jgi:uncharacterized flavoprotein (TIGR03862 family)
MLGCCLDTSRFSVSIYEQNAAPGRKFLVAGDGGLNITHSMSPEDFILRYRPDHFLREAFSFFSNRVLIDWLHGLGIETYTGSSGRVFPAKDLKPVDVLNRIVARVNRNKVEFCYRHRWVGFSDSGLQFLVNDRVVEINADKYIFCLGGASWPVTGSRGDWLKLFKEKEIDVVPFEASNCEFLVDWQAGFISGAEGAVLKNISISCGGRVHFGEVVITRQGLEGSGIYPLSPEIRMQIKATGSATILMDLKPAVTLAKIIERLQQERMERSFTAHVKEKLNLTGPQIALIKSVLSKTGFLDITRVAAIVKALPLRITGAGPLEEAISTVGGISLAGIRGNFELKKLPDHFCIGEMLDYDAPTGGYLLQSCFSMAAWLSFHLNKSETLKAEKA